MAKHRVHEIDVLRALACLSVVGFHYLFQGQRLGWLSEHASPAIEYLARLGQLGVHLFFMISGFVIFMSAQGAGVRGFAVSRAARLYPALWVAAPLTALVGWAQLNPEFHVSFGEVVVNMTLLAQWFHVRFVDGVYWSLVVELQFYLLVTLAIAFKALDRVEWLVGGWLLISAVNAMRPMYPLQLWLVVQWAPYFAAGICAYLIRDRGANASRVSLFVMSFVLALVYEVGPVLRPSRGRLPDPALAAAFAVGLVLIFGLFVWIARGRSRYRGSAVALWAGLLTYPVYLLHQHIGYVLIEGLAPTGLGLGWRAGLALLFIGAVAAVVVRWVERPLQRWLKRVVIRATDHSSGGPPHDGGTPNPVVQA